MIYNGHEAVEGALVALDISDFDTDERGVTATAVACVFSSLHVRTKGLKIKSREATKQNDATVRGMRVRNDDQVAE